LRQIGALPLILLEDGQVEVYLVTSRNGRRWIIPKGNPMRGLSPCDVAALEAREEAGVIGLVLDSCLGEFTLRGRHKKCRVAVYPLIVQEKLLHWDEVGERQWRRCDLKTARGLVGSRSLAALLGSLSVKKVTRLMASASELRAQA
jgi:8-oxo-dGTP pyrophosphatase MutT (NUDIX family)